MQGIHALMKIPPDLQPPGSLKVLWLQIAFSLQAPRSCGQDYY